MSWRILFSLVFMLGAAGCMLVMALLPAPEFYRWGFLGVFCAFFATWLARIEKWEDKQ